MSSPEDQIAQLGAQLSALTGVVEKLAGVYQQPVEPAPPPVQPAPEVESDIYDEVKEGREMREARKQQAETMRKADQITEELLPLILQERDMEVLNWVRGDASVGKAVQEIVRGALAKRRADFREANGAGGSSSRDISKLKDRI